MREFTAVIIYTGGQYKGSPTNIIKNKLLCFEGEFIMLKIKKIKKNLLPLDFFICNCMFYVEVLLSLKIMKVKYIVKC